MKIADWTDGEALDKKMFSDFIGSLTSDECFMLLLACMFFGESGIWEEEQADDHIDQHPG